MAILLTVFLVALAWAYLRFKNIGSREPGLPRGPPTTPLLGNLGIFPKEYAYVKLTEWARIWGGIYSLKLGPSTAIVITDPVAVKELMDKRSRTTSSRPTNFIIESINGGLDLTLMSDNDTWRTLRKAAHTILTPQMSAKHLPIQYAETTQLLFDILRTPKDFYTHVQRYSNSVIMSVLYGKRCPRYESPETTLFFTEQREYLLLTEPGSTPPLDFFPWLRYVPERWARWKTDVRRCRKLQRNLFFGLLDETRTRMERGEENGSYMEDIIRRREELEMDREMTGYLGGALLEGGSDTTSQFLHTMILAMIIYSEVQQKAQAELDRVVGPNRLPTLEDFPSLPYVQAIIRETHRIRPVAPLIPHASTALEEYNGYLIPEGSIIFVNIWGIYHDPDIYDDPETFNPERYLKTENGTRSGVDGSDLRPNLQFGCGRRICPGIHLAQNSINLDTMRLLWAFTFSRATDPRNGKDIDVSLDLKNYSKGLITGPLPFKASITPRSSATAETIEREFRDATDTFAKFEVGISQEDREFLEKYRR